MSRRRWLYQFAAFGIGAVAFAAAMSLAVYNEPKSGTTYDKQDAPQQPDDEAGAIKLALRAYEEGQAFPYQSKCDYPESREDADLCEQQRSANAAEKVVWWGKLQFVATAFTLVFLGWTVIENRRTANAAAAAVKQGDEANRIELRAYISVEPEGVTQLVGSLQLMGHVAVRNVGKLPAQNVSVLVKMTMVEDRDFDPLLPDSDVVRVKRALAPGIFMSQGSADLLHVVDLHNKPDYIFVWGLVLYDDGFGKPRFTRFAHRYRKDSSDQTLLSGTYPRPMARLHSTEARYHDKGNEAN